MKLTRKYKFYAAHRNQHLCDKCRNIHGHVYRVRIMFDFNDFKSENNITQLFADLDKQIDPIIKEYDHGMLIDKDDPLLDILKKFDNTLKFKVLPFPTSIENLSLFLYAEICRKTDLGEIISRIEIDETDSSTIHLDTEWIKSDLSRRNQHRLLCEWVADQEL